MNKRILNSLKAVQFNSISVCGEFKRADKKYIKDNCKILFKGIFFKDSVNDIFRAYSCL